MATQNLPQSVMQAGSFSKAVANTPADSDLSTLADAVYVGGAGNLSVILADDSTAVTFVGVPAGTLLRLRVKQIRSTSTTATSIVELRV
ncbi:MAG: hypothetical protein ACE5H8_16040 [Alphaproteobacteria bacterium]